MINYIVYKCEFSLTLCSYVEKLEPVVTCISTINVLARISGLSAANIHSTVNEVLKDEIYQSQ